MLVPIVIAALVAGVAAAITLGKFASSGKWSQTEGVVRNAEIEVLDTRPDSPRGTGTGYAVQYRVNIVYEYSAGEGTITGDDLFAGIPPIFSERSNAEEMLDRFRPGEPVTVFFNPQNPAESCLITGKAIPLAGYIVIGMIVALAVAGIIVIGMLATGIVEPAQLIGRGADTPAS